MSESVVNEQHIEMLTRQIQGLEDRMIDPREFGRLEQEVKQLTTQMAALQITLTQTQSTLNAINTTLSEARGGWKTLMMFGGAGAVGGQVLHWVLQSLKVIP